MKMALSLSHIFYDIWFNLSPSDLLNNIVDNKVIPKPGRPPNPTPAAKDSPLKKGLAPGAIRQRINEGQSACKCNANVC